MNNPFSTLTKKEWLLWLGSLFIVLVSNILAANFDPLTLIAALVGVTSLVFAAKGNVWAQVLMIVFSILYGIISFRFRYWGEMITYLGMALTMLRSSYYALGYAANDVVLIVLWLLASLTNSGYLPVAVNFIIFFFNDLYGFISWKKREVLQA